MKVKLSFILILVFLWHSHIDFISAQPVIESNNSVVLFPANNAKNVNPDTHLEITFSGKPVLGNKGQVRVYDMENNLLVDLLDLSIAPGPTERNMTHAPYTPVPYKYISGNFTNANTKPGTPSGLAEPTPDTFQLTIIGGFTDGFHFYPVIIRDNTATIYLHHNLLEYNKTYRVEIDPEVLVPEQGSFSGISREDEWIFSTKPNPPSAESSLLLVNGDGTGDFSTVQGAIDYIPDYHPERITIYIKNGVYEEIVYFRNKTNITFLGEDRDKVVVQYANREVFNPHPSNITTNEVKGTFPSRRAVFAVDNSSNIHLMNMTIRNLSEIAQAEGLLLNGEKNIVYNVHIVGSGDALQSNGSAYYQNCKVDGWGDVILGRGPAFFKDCQFTAKGPYMWIRNTEENHGNVFINCEFVTAEGKETLLARAPTNHGKNYPYSEAVLINCKMQGIAPEGWGQIGGETKDIRYWEYNSTNISDGKPVDISKRHPASRQLSMQQDSAMIAKYSDPAFVLGGWTPLLFPTLLQQPGDEIAKKGDQVTLTFEVAAIPEAEFQWFKGDKMIPGEKGSTLILENVRGKDAGNYHVIVRNSAGSLQSRSIMVKVK
jgi:pectin methylesterase-like acyl-CoA thioesterase